MANTWSCKQVYNRTHTHTLSYNTCRFTNKCPTSPVSGSSHRLRYLLALLWTGIQRWILTAVQRSAVSAERDWLLSYNGSVLLVWGAAVRTHLQHVDDNRAIRATGGGPEASVAVHVKHQQARVKHVMDVSTCVFSKKYVDKCFLLYSAHALVCILWWIQGTSSQIHELHVRVDHDMHVSSLHRHTAALSVWTMCTAMRLAGRTGLMEVCRDEVWNVPIRLSM